MKQLKFKYLIFLLLFFVLPWINNESLKENVIPPVSQESNAFYEINPCKVSLFRFIQENPKSIYQDHYKFRPNDQSSISCFGRISGVTVLQPNSETLFYISVGTNSFINLILQGLLWICFLSLIPKNLSKDNKYYKKPLTQVLIGLASFIFTFSIYAQNRFYENSLYVFDFLNKKSYVLVFSSFFLLIKLILNIYSTRKENFINYLPYIFLINGIFSGYNLNFYSLLIITIGTYEVFKKNNLKTFNKYYIFLSFWWLLNSHGSYSFKVGKLRSFTSSSYDFNSNLFWVMFFFFLINGLWLFINESKDSFNLYKFTNNMSRTAIMILSLGIIGSNFPIVSFYSYYYLGLQRYVVELTNPFLFDEYLVKISWRGIYPSSETIGEFFGICLLFLLFSTFKSQQLNRLQVFAIIFSSFGVYFSDNKTSIVLVFISVLIYFYAKYLKDILNSKFIVQMILIFLITGLVVLIVGFGNTQASYEFASLSLKQKAFLAQNDSFFSSFLLLLDDSYNNNSIFKQIFSFIGVVAFLLNRSEMWGVFFARYNPTFSELIFGSGPLNFGQLYGETLINSNDSLLLPHSSILSFLVFFGLIPLVFVVLLVIYKTIKNKKNIEFVLISTFILLNVAKNDSLNYFSNFVFYFCLFFMFEEKESKFSE